MPGRRKHRDKREKSKKDRQVIDHAKPYVFLPGDKESPKVEWKEIIYLSAAGNYTDLHLVKHTIKVITITLGIVQHSLPPTVFFRIHESFLVNLNHIAKVLKNRQIVMDDGKTLTVSKPNWEPLLKLLPFIRR